MEELATLVERSRSGDLTAFETLVRRFQDMACGYAYSILGDFHLAEDAAQEAFVDAYGKLYQLREPKAFAGWFRRIVFKHCDRVTRRKQVPTVPLVSSTFATSTRLSALIKTSTIRKRVIQSLARSWAVPMPISRIQSHVLLPQRVQGIIPL